MFGGEGAWENADKTTVQCNNSACTGNEAAFYQIQIRSADEPMTSFYKVSLVLVPCDGLFESRYGYGYGYGEDADFDVVHDLRSPMERELDDVGGGCNGDGFAGRRCKGVGEMGI